MARIESTNRLGTGLGGGRPKVAVAVYDSSVDSKETGSVTLRGDTLPSGAVITDSLVVVDTKLESTEANAATVLLTAESEGDLQASKKASEAPWSSTGSKRGAVTATGTPVVTTAARSVVAKIGVKALTAGKFRVLVTYLELA